MHFKEWKERITNLVASFPVTTEEEAHVAEVREELRVVEVGEELHMAVVTEQFSHKKTELKFIHSVKDYRIRHRITPYSDCALPYTAMHNLNTELSGATFGSLSRCDIDIVYSIIHS